MSQDEVYQLLATFGPLTARQIADGMEMSIAATGSALRRLEKWGDAVRHIGKPLPGNPGTRCFWEAI